MQETRNIHFIFNVLRLFISENRYRSMNKYFFEKWLRSYFNFVRNICTVGVMISCLFVNPGEGALYLMTINEVYTV